MSSVILEAHDLTKEYRHTVALDHIDLKIEKGKIYGRCVKVNFDDITRVVFATLSGKPVDATRIHIYKGKKKVLSLDPVMENYDKMKNYLLDHIDETKIDIIS